MAHSKKAHDASAEDISAKTPVTKLSIFEKYRDFLEEHLSREDHNTQRVSTDVLTVKTEGTFDYVSLTWDIHSDELERRYPGVKKEQWTLWGLRRFDDFTALDSFPKIVDGEVFIKSSQLKGNHREYLKTDASTNFAFFLVGKNGSFLQGSRQDIVGPITLSLTPLRSSTREMWQEIAELMRAQGDPSPKKSTPLSTKLSLLDEFTEKETAIQNDSSLSEEQKQTKIERVWALYHLFENEDR